MRIGPAWELKLNERSVRRWKKQLREKVESKDRRKGAAGRRVPANKLTHEEKVRILDICNQGEYRSSPPSQVVPRLADKRVYIASESSFYRVLHEANQLNRRGRAKAPGTVAKPKGYKAEAPCYLSHYPTIDFPKYFTVIKDKFLTLTAPVE